MSFLEEGFGEVLSAQDDDLFGVEQDFDLFEPSDNGFGGDSLMSEFDSDSPTRDPEPFQSAPQPSEPSQWTSHQPPISPPAHPFPQSSQHLSSSQAPLPPSGAPHSLHQNQHLHHHQTTQPQSVPRISQHLQQQAFGYPAQYQQQFQQQQQQFSPQAPHPQQTMAGSFQPMEFSAPFSPPTSQPGALHFKKRRTLSAAPPPSHAPSLRPIALQVANTQYLAQLSAPPSPPPPPPKGHLTSMANPAPLSQTPFPPFLAPSLSDSETRYLSEDDFAGGELRMIAPKPPSLPPADYHRRSTQRPPHDAICPSPALKRRSRTKRRSTSKLEREQKIKFHLDKERFLGGSELQDQLVVLSAKCAASEAESKALKERLSATESELAELRLKVQRFDSMNIEMGSPISPVALSPCDTVSPTPSIML